MSEDELLTPTRLIHGGTDALSRTAPKTNGTPTCAIVIGSTAQSAAFVRLTRGSGNRALRFRPLPLAWNLDSDGIFNRQAIGIAGATNRGGQSQGGQLLSRGKKNGTEQLVPKFQAAEEEIAREMAVIDAVREIGVAEQTCHR